ncbi:MAG: nucleoside/nucleotide kinase family protein [Erysipelotrichaceae bacterium]|nr:nucleoside/nucleotide kinase family protein [Erysipelotrichaceae bacterium]
MDREYTLSVNGLMVLAGFNDSLVDGVFKKLLHKWTDLQKEKDRRIFVFLAAPPGAGKSTLAQFLEGLSQTTEGVTPLQAVGMDGFHYKQEYLNTHYIPGSNQLLKTIKGAPETFDCAGLREKIIESRDKDILWPVYSRILHDVEDDKLKVEGKIILLEGNYLLLNEDPWTSLHELCDDTLFINADPDILKKRLVERKANNPGTDLEKATEHFMKVDRVNGLRVINNSIKANTTLYMNENEQLYLKDE